MDVNPVAPPDLDLSPRPTTGRRPRRLWAFALVVVVLAGLAFVMTKALSDAALFFYNADEAVEKQDELGESRFRLQGTVEAGSISESGIGVEFVVVYNGVEVFVAHEGDPIELFDEGTPVVLEGHWNDAGTRFESDRMLVKHDEEYEEKNDERLHEADQGGEVPVSSSSVPTP